MGSNECEGSYHDHQLDDRKLRVDMVARRATQNCVKMMFRAYVFYQPGGGAERHDVLRRLQNPLDFVGGDSMQQTLQAVRAWPRWLERCRGRKCGCKCFGERFNGLNRSSHGQVVRCQLPHSYAQDLTTLRWETYCGTSDCISTTPNTQGGGATQPKLRAVEPASAAKAKDAAGKAQASPDLCRYFAKASGCKRGDKCSYSHSMSGMEKDVRARKRLRCGAENHRQKDCPVGRSTKPTTTPTVPVSVQSTMATMGTSEATTSSQGSTIQGTKWTLEALIQAAQQVVQPHQAESPGESSPEKTKPQVRTMKL